MKIKLLLLSLISLSLIACDSAPEDKGAVVLPDGTVVRHYQLQKNGSWHNIYVTEGVVTTTDNTRQGKSSHTDVTIQK